MPRSPLDRVFLSAQWRWLVMLNWEVLPDSLQDHVPNGTKLDFFEGSTFVSIVGFLFQNTRLLGVPIPGHRNFEELNLRFYVSRSEEAEQNPDQEHENKRGVAFISELVPKKAIASIARRFYNENYFAAPMKHKIAPAAFDGCDDNSSTTRVNYQWKTMEHWNHLSANGIGRPQTLVEGSLEQFIAEHYWGYSEQRDGSTLEYRVQHPPWNIWQASDVDFCCDVENQYGKSFGRLISSKPDSAFIADGSPVTVSFPRRIKI